MDFDRNTQTSTYFATQVLPLALLPLALLPLLLPLLPLW